jgi:hypothetical protein
MNLYFVFEGKTEPVVYRSWLAHLVPRLTEVDSFRAVTSNEYYYESDMGVPDCFNVVCNAIQEINLHPVFDKLVLIIDADRMQISDRRESAFNAIQERLKEPKFQYKGLPRNCTMEILVQRVCIETWFLGNRKFFVRNPQSPLLLQYIQFFDVSIHDPEELASKYRHVDCTSKYLFGYATIALFHVGYLREIFKERHTSYFKSRPREVKEVSYLNELAKRCTDDSSHLNSFQEFIQFCSDINKSISPLL